jgi:hypothetical protein
MHLAPARRAMLFIALTLAIIGLLATLGVIGLLEPYAFWLAFLAWLLVTITCVSEQP